MVTSNGDMLRLNDHVAVHVLCYVIETAQRVGGPLFEKSSSKVAELSMQHEPRRQRALLSDESCKRAVFLVGMPHL